MSQQRADDSNNFIFPFKHGKLQFVFSLLRCCSCVSIKTGRELDQTHKNDSRLISIFKSKQKKLKKRYLMRYILYPTHHYTNATIAIERIECTFTTNPKKTKEKYRNFNSCGMIYTASNDDYFIKNSGKTKAMMMMTIRFFCCSFFPSTSQHRIIIIMIVVDAFVQRYSVAQAVNA